MASKNQAYYIRLTILAILTFFTGWADLLSNVRFGAFVSCMTGNSVWFGLSLVPSHLFEEVGATDLLQKHSPWFYLAVVAMNVVGALCFSVTNKYITSRWSGIAVALFAIVLGVAGELAYQLDHETNWAALAFSCIFGAINSFSMSDPLKANTSVMTGNLQKIPKWILKCVQERRLVRVEPVGAILPFFLIGGSATVASILAVNDGNLQFYQAWYSSMTPIIAIAITLVVHDIVVPHMKEPKKEKPKEQPETKKETVEEPPTTEEADRQTDKTETENNDETTADSMVVININDSTSADRTRGDDIV